MQQEPRFTLTVTQTMMNVIMEGLSQLKLGQSVGTYTDIMSQVAELNKPHKVESEPVPE